MSHIRVSFRKCPLQAKQWLRWFSLGCMWRTYLVLVPCVVSTLWFCLHFFLPSSFLKLDTHIRHNSLPTCWNLTRKSSIGQSVYNFSRKCSNGYYEKNNDIKVEGRIAVLLWEVWLHPKKRLLGGKSNDWLWLLIMMFHQVKIKNTVNGHILWCVYQKALCGFWTRFTYEMHFVILMMALLNEWTADNLH